MSYFLFKSVNLFNRIDRRHKIPGPMFKLHVTWFVPHQAICHIKIFKVFIHYFLTRSDLYHSFSLISSISSQIKRLLQCVDHRHQ